MQRKAILVLGMHRSGTSAFARMLSLLGCDLPHDLMPGWEGNPKGHWESNAIRALNDEILASAGSGWDDWLEFNSNWYESPAYSAFFKRALDVLWKDYGTSPFFVLKDPRSCRLTRFWLAVLEKADVEPLIAIPVRNPLEVADSLERRNGTHPDITMLIWLRHALDAERDSRGRRRVFTTYDQLLADWSSVAEKVQRSLGITWPRFSPRAAVEIDEFLDHGSRHHTRPQQSGASNPMLPTWLRETHAIFFRWAESGENADDYGRLDEITTQFNAAGPTFVRLGHDITRDRTETQELRASLQERDEKILQVSGELSRLAGSTVTNSELQDQIEKISVERASLETDKAALEKQLASLHDRTNGLEAELGAALEREAANAVAFTAERRAQVQTAELLVDRASLEADKAALEKQLASLHDRTNGLEAELGAALEREAANAVAFTAERRAQVQTAELLVDRASLEADKAALEKQLASLHDRTDGLEAELSAALEREAKNAAVFAAERSAQVRQMALQDEAFTELGLEKNAINTTLAATQQELENLKTQLRDRQHILEVAQNTLRQREEEIFQTLANLEEERERSAEAEAQRHITESTLADAEAKLQDANAWVFNLAGDRKAAEVRATSAEARLAKMEIALSLSATRLETFAHQQKQDSEEKNRLRNQNRDLEDLSKALRVENDEIVERWDTAQSELAALSKLLRQKETEQPAPATQHTSVEHRNEVAALSGRLRMREAEASRLAHQAEWLQKVNAVVTSYPSWWSFAPKVWRRKWQHKRLLRKGLFDAGAYLSRYPDVLDAGVDPLRHYITHGMIENRTFD